MCLFTLTHCVIRNPWLITPRYNSKVRVIFMTKKYQLSLRVWMLEGKLFIKCISKFFHLLSTGNPWLIKPLGVKNANYVYVISIAKRYQVNFRFWMDFSSTCPCFSISWHRKLWKFGCLNLEIDIPTLGFKHIHWEYIGFVCICIARAIFQVKVQVLALMINEIAKIWKLVCLR